MPITNKQIHEELQKVKEDVRDIKIHLLENKQERFCGLFGLL